MACILPASRLRSCLWHNVIFYSEYSVMIIKEKLGNLNEFDATHHVIDRLSIEWFETGKRILHKETGRGRQIVLKFMKENPNLQQDDVLYKDENSFIVIDIRPCDAIVVKPSSMYQVATLCYEIGNKHLPLFYENDVLLLPFEEPIFRWLTVAGFNPEREKRKLSNQLKTSVAAHAHSGSLFSKILQLTNSSNA